eukprot:6175501-Pleurochrysis_carterae.AAC.1
MYARCSARAATRSGSDVGHRPTRARADDARRVPPLHALGLLWPQPRRGGCRARQRRHPLRAACGRGPGVAAKTAGEKQQEVGGRERSCRTVQAGSDSQEVSSYERQNSVMVPHFVSCKTEATRRK